MLRLFCQRACKQLNRSQLLCRKSFSNIRLPPWENNYQNNNRVIYGIMGLNVAVFAAWYESERDYKLRKFMNNHFLLSNQGIKKGYLHTMVTSFFSHKDIWHLGFNLLTFYTFGSNIIMSLGIRKFLGLYMVGGLASSSFFILEPYILPKSWPSYYLNKNMFFGDRRALGASGAVSAIVYYSILMNPAQTILVMFVPMPAIAGLLLFLGYDLYGMFTGGGSIGHSGHLAGASVGSAYFLYRRLRRF